MLLCSLLLLLVDNLADVEQGARADEGEQIAGGVAIVGLDHQAIVLQLHYVVDKGCQLLIIDCGNELLPALDDAHYLPPEVAVAGHAAVADAAALVLAVL